MPLCGDGLRQGRVRKLRFAPLRTIRSLRARQPPNGWQGLRLLLAFGAPVMKLAYIRRLERRGTCCRPGSSPGWGIFFIMDNPACVSRGNYADSFFTGSLYVRRLPSPPVIAAQMRSPSSHLRVFQWNSASAIYLWRCFLLTAWCVP